MEFGTLISQGVLLFLSIFPRRILIESTHQGLKFVVAPLPRGRPYIRVLEPGSHWYFPISSIVHTLPVVKSVVKLTPHYVLTKDGKPFSVSGTIRYTVDDIEEAVSRSYDVISSIDDEAESALCQLIADRTSQEVTDMSRSDLNKLFTEVANKRLEVYGIYIEAASVTTLVTGTVLMHITTGQSGYADVEE